MNLLEINCFQKVSIYLKYEADIETIRLRNWKAQAVPVEQL